MIKCTFENGHTANLRHVTVDSLAIKDNKILLVKRAAHLTNPNKYALPGGYLDRDETTAQAAVRELREETGYAGTVTDLFRICDNPDRRGEDRQNVGFIYLVQVGEKNGESDDEISEVKWFDLDQLPDEAEFAFDHFEHINRYKTYLGQGTAASLPLLKGMYDS